MTAVYDGTRRCLATDLPASGVDDLPQPPSAGTSITLTFLTPTRLIHDGENASPAEFHVLFRNVLRRVNFLNHFHSGGKLGDVTAALIAEAQLVRTVDSRLRWREWDRYSARQDRRVPMGGFVGEVRYEEELARLLPWLGIGEWVHVGKGVTFGLGRYRLEYEAHGAAPGPHVQATNFEDTAHGRS